MKFCDCSCTPGEPLYGGFLPEYCDSREKVRAAFIRHIERELREAKAWQDKGRFGSQASQGFSNQSAVEYSQPRWAVHFRGKHVLVP